MLFLFGTLMLSCSNHSQLDTRYHNQMEESDSVNQDSDDVVTKVTMKSNRFYQDLLEDFCKKYYHKKFPGRSYVYGSLYVDNVSLLENNTFVVIGTHTFKGRMGIFTYKHKEFKATVREDGSDLYHIRFDRRLELIGHEWVSTGELPFNYDGDESK